MEHKYGTVSKIRTLKLNARPLIRFTLDNVNCLIAAHSLNFLAEVDEGMKLYVIFEKSKYPKRNHSK